MTIFPVSKLARSCFVSRSRSQRPRRLWVIEASFIFNVVRKYVVHLAPMAPRPPPRPPSRPRKKARKKIRPHRAYPALSMIQSRMNPTQSSVWKKTRLRFDYQRAYSNKKRQTLVLTNMTTGKILKEERAYGDERKYSAATKHLHKRCIKITKQKSKKKVGSQTEAVLARNGKCFGSNQRDQIDKRIIKTPRRRKNKRQKRHRSLWAAFSYYFYHSIHHRELFIGYILPPKQESRVPLDNRNTPCSVSI